MATPARSTPAIRFGAFALDVAKGELRKGATLLKLHPQPFRLLTLLIERAPGLVTREEIQQSLWGGHTWVDFDGGINFCIRQIRSTLADSAETPRYVETVPRSGYRFIFPLSLSSEHDDQVIPISRALPSRQPNPVVGLISLSAFPAPTLQPLPSTAIVAARTPGRFLTTRNLCFAILLFAALAACSYSYFYFHRAPKLLTERDTVFIADFLNSTNDPIFNDALKQGLAINLAQSPFLNILPSGKADETLNMMGRPADTPLTGDTARELCIRSRSKVLINSSISQLGTHYVVGLDAVLCATGETIARTQAEAAKKEDVLSALSKASSSLRMKLGESLPSLQKYDVSIPSATTTSIEALQNYALSGKIWRRQGEIPSLPPLLRAVELDPNFAMAYDGLARRYNNLNEPTVSLDYAAKAYALRDRITERERLMISSSYFRSTGEIEKLHQVLDLWSAHYPRSAPHVTLGASHLFLGQYDQAVSQLQTGLQEDPDTVTNYEDLAGNLIALDRLPEATAVVQQAASHNISSADLHFIAYTIAFLHHDSSEMERQLAAVSSIPGAEDVLLASQADTEAFYGRLQSANNFSARAIDSANRAGLQEVAVMWQSLAALRLAQFGDDREAIRTAENALSLYPGRNVKFFSAMALAFAGDIPRAQQLADDLEREHSSNTAFSLHRLPTLHAAIKLQQRNPAKALELLESARPYELGQPSPMPYGVLFVPYLRGEAFLMNRDGVSAAAEFQKILDHEGIAFNSLVAALSYLQLARAYVLQGDTARARQSYQTFLSLWQDADPHIPVFLQAQSEFAHLTQ